MYNSYPHFTLNMEIPLMLVIPCDLDPSSHTQYQVLLTVITEIIHQDYLCYQMFGTSGEHTVNENKGFFTLQVQSYTGIFTLYHKIMSVIQIPHSSAALRKSYLMWKILSKSINDILVLTVNSYQ